MLDAGGIAVRISVGGLIMAAINKILFIRSSSRLLQQFYG
jgi:hypothetical protein